MYRISLQNAPYKQGEDPRFQSLLVAEERRLKLRTLDQLRVYTRFWCVIIPTVFGVWYLLMPILTGNTLAYSYYQSRSAAAFGVGLVAVLLFLASSLYSLSIAYTHVRRMLRDPSFDAIRITPYGKKVTYQVALQVIYRRVWRLMVLERCARLILAVWLVLELIGLFVSVNSPDSASIILVFIFIGSLLIIWIYESEWRMRALVGIGFRAATISTWHRSILILIGDTIALAVAAGITLMGSNLLFIQTIAPMNIIPWEFAVFCLVAWEILLGIIVTRWLYKVFAVNPQEMTVRLTSDRLLSYR